MADVAMFPLGTVLFPHTPLALRIFEQRYLMMLGRVLDDEEPSFGVVLIERGSEAGGGDQRFSVGTMARILQVDPRADDLHVIAVGGTRVAVDRWLEDDPYPAASVTPIPELEWSDELAPLQAAAPRSRLEGENARRHVKPTPRVLCDPSSLTCRRYHTR